MHMLLLSLIQHHIMWIQQSYHGYFRVGNFVMKNVNLLTYCWQEWNRTLGCCSEGRKCI